MDLTGLGEPPLEEHDHGHEEHEIEASSFLGGHPPTPRDDVLKQRRSLARTTSATMIIESKLLLLQSEILRLRQENAALRGGGAGAEAEAEAEAEAAAPAASGTGRPPLVRRTSGRNTGKMATVTNVEMLVESKLLLLQAEIARLTEVTAAQAVAIEVKDAELEALKAAAAQ